MEEEEEGQAQNDPPIRSLTLAPPPARGRKMALSAKTAVVSLRVKRLEGFLF